MYTTGPLHSTTPTWEYRHVTGSATNCNTRDLQKVSTLHILQLHFTDDYKNKIHHFFCIITLLFNTFFLVSYQLLNAIIIVFSCTCSHWCTALFTSSSHRNLLPPKASSSGQKRWKSDDTKSGLWTGCSMATHFNFPRVSNVCIAAWWGTLSCNSR